MAVSRLTLAEILGNSPGSSVFSTLVASARFYGLTTGGINADEFGITPLGEQAASADEEERVTAYKAAVMKVEPYRLFFETFKNKKVPSPTPFKEFLVRNASVEPNYAEECMQAILADGRTAGFIRAVQGNDYIDLSGTPAAVPDAANGETVIDDAGQPIHSQGGQESEPLAPPQEPPLESSGQATSTMPKKVFIAHGKNRVPLDQLKKALDQFRVKYAVAVDEPNKGRPVSAKVAQLMKQECSSGIFIFTADERFLKELPDGSTEEIWRPSENVVYELGAASIIYDRRIVIFKEKSVSFPSDFSDLGYIEFEKDQLGTEIGTLFTELVSLDILEVRAKG
jgi:hypothetical protein